MMNTALKGAKMEDVEIRLYDASGGEKKHLLYGHGTKQFESQDLPVEANEGIQPEPLQRVVRLADGRTPMDSSGSLQQKSI